MGLIVISYAAIAQPAATFSASKKTDDNPPTNYTPILVNQPRIYSGTFFTGFGGPALIDWQNFEPPAFTYIRKDPKGGVAYGFGTGYRFYSYFGIEGAYIRLPTVKGTGFTNASVPRAINSIGISSWLGYALGRFYIAPPIFKFFYITLGAGIMYRSVNPKPSELFTNSQAYYYAAIYSVGLEWDISEDWFFLMNYFYVPAYNEEIRLQGTKFFNTPSANLFMFGIGYKFAV